VYELTSYRRLLEHVLLLQKGMYPDGGSYPLEHVAQAIETCSALPLIMVKTFVPQHSGQTSRVDSQLTCAHQTISPIAKGI